MKITSVDLCGNKITTELSGPSDNNDLFKLRVVNPNSSTEIFQATRKPGKYTDPFNLSSIPEGIQFTKVEAVYVCGGANHVAGYAYIFKKKGTYRHSQYNSPHESHPTCAGAPVNVCITGIAGGNCTYQAGTLKSVFKSEVDENGSGVSINYGPIAVEAFCNSPPPNLANRPRYRGNYPRTPACAGGALNGSTVARDPNDSDLPCGAKICIVGAGPNSTNLVKVVTDRCPACIGKKQIDNFTTLQNCTGISDLGNFMTVKIP